MKPERKAFQPLNTDDLDTKIETLAREKGVGALVKPAKSEQGPSAPDPLPAVLPQASQSPLRNSRKPLSMDVPDYLWTELKIQAVHRQTSVRHIVLTALRAEGFQIAESDMSEDGRRARGRNALPH